MNRAIGHTSQYIVTEVELAVPNQAEIHPSFTQRFSTSHTQQGKVENISIPPSAPCWGVSPRDETPPVPLNSTPPGQKYWYSSLETLSHQPPPPPPSSQHPELPKQTARTFDSGPSDDNSSNDDQDYIGKQLEIPLSSVSRVSSPSNIRLASITNDLIPNIPDPVCLGATDNKSVAHGDIIRIHEFFTSVIPEEPCSNNQGGSPEGSACSGINNRAVDAGTPLFTRYSRILQNTVACKSCKTLPLDSHLLCSNAAQVVSVILSKGATSSASGLITDLDTKDSEKRRKGGARLAGRFQAVFINLNSFPGLKDDKCRVPEPFMKHDQHFEFTQTLTPVAKAHGEKEVLRILNQKRDSERQATRRQFMNL
ncbi:hypothetical protein C8J56DRAFT_889308 [Mycena floridula]|nr:hypothetical protein C8J56DRAFT_889308 [Mycena floridula]